jgi:hypothetical protein
MKILHLDIKDHVTAYKLMIWGWGHATRQDVESNTHIFHLLLNVIAPKGVPVALLMAYASSTVLGISIPYL